MSFIILRTNKHFLIGDFSFIRYAHEKSRVIMTLVHAQCFHGVYGYVHGLNADTGIMEMCGTGRFQGDL